eukprot:3583128-Rhodomonas_salina.1
MEKRVGLSTCPSFHVIEVALDAVSVERDEDLHVLVRECSSLMRGELADAPCVEDVEVRLGEITSAEPGEDVWEGGGVILGSDIGCELHYRPKLSVQRETAHVLRGCSGYVVVQRVAHDRWQLSVVTDENDSPEAAPGLHCSILCGHEVGDSAEYHS